jgi:hypothetical protein
MKSTDRNHRRAVNFGSFKKLLLSTGMLGFAIGDCVAETSVAVDKSMLLWKKNFEYYTAVTAEISLTNTNILVNLTDRTARGTQPRSFHYRGIMAYNTELGIDEDYNGSAIRYYQLCKIVKSENNPLELKVDSGMLEALYYKVFSDLPPEIAPHVEVVKSNMFGGSYVIVRQKKDGPHDLLGGSALELAFQSMEDLSGKLFLIEWIQADDLRKAMVKVKPAEKRNGRAVALGGNVSPVVKDVVGRESKLLYEALLGLSNERRDGDQWTVDGETLDAMVHPSVQGAFRGFVVVKAEKIKGQSPDLTVDVMNGFKLKFIPSGMVDGRNYNSNLRFVLETVDGANHETQLTPEDGKFTGEIWLDTDNQSVRFGELIVNSAKYDGFLPKIGELNAKIKLKGDLNFKLKYTQAITAKEQ